MSFLEKVEEHRDKALKVLKRIDAEKKFSEFAREKFNEVGLKSDSTKAEDMLESLYTIGTQGENEEVKVKAIKTFAEMVGGGMNEKTMNVQNNQFNFGEFLEKLK